MHFEVTSIYMSQPQRRHMRTPESRMRVQDSLSSWIPLQYVAYQRVAVQPFGAARHAAHFLRGLAGVDLVVCSLDVPRSATRAFITLVLHVLLVGHRHFFLAITAPSTSLSPLRTSADTIPTGARNLRHRSAWGSRLSCCRAWPDNCLHRTSTDTPGNPDHPEWQIWSSCLSTGPPGRPARRRPRSPRCPAARCGAGLPRCGRDRP